MKTSDIFYMRHELDLLFKPFKLFSLNLFDYSLDRQYLYKSDKAVIKLVKLSPELAVKLFNKTEYHLGWIKVFYNLFKTDKKDHDTKLFRKRRLLILFLILMSLK